MGAVGDRELVGLHAVIATHKIVEGDAAMPLGLEQQEPHDRPPTWTKWRAAYRRTSGRALILLNIPVAGWYGVQANQFPVTDGAHSALIATARCGQGR
ncbi:MAG: hypothetical protein EOP93_19190 [Lysobacteraceae bacterium]|nr:MAG: hypothetical protein EOP93_19190 [Xanthomonadaceae bacterium]